MAVLLIVTVFLTGFSILQYNYLNQVAAENNMLHSENNLLNTRYQHLLALSSDTDKAIAFIQDVVQLDISEYQATLLSSDVEFRSDLGGIVEEILRYSLADSEARIDVVLRFRDQLLSRYQIYVFEGAPIYSEPQPINLVDSATNLLERYRQYGNASYLDQMSDLLAMVDEVKNVEIVEGNMKLKISASEERTEFFWLYTESDVDFSPKSLSFVYENRALKQLTDGWFLFETGSTEVNVSREEAITIAAVELKKNKDEDEKSLKESSMDTGNPKGGDGSASGKTMKRADFNNLSPEEKAEIAKSGVKFTE